ncbi:MAG: proteasome accessory factor PafA2 family protein, partial [Anaerolineae bacterium]|nr:proteasome accessory factor PafA2 family protein [Anaerolineae bacterium]
MALQDRVFSIETEYAITFYADHDHKPGSGKIVDVLMQAVAESHGTRAGSFLLNGSRLAHDVGHAEWSLPECRSGREIAVYDKAADHLYIETVVPRATQLMRREGFSGRVAVAKNNADPFGNTYGCHENYQMKYNADLLADDDFIRYVAQAMIPFLTTRLIFAGSGRVTIGGGGTSSYDRRSGSTSSSFRRPSSSRRNRTTTGSFRRSSLGRNRLNYEFSQRAGFIQTVVSRDTTRARPIFNLGREGESFAVGNYRRLHQIMGDAT